MNDKTKTLPPDPDKMNNERASASESYASAAYWAQQLGKNALFCDLRDGEAFRFKANGNVCRRINARGWYIVEDGTGRKYRTGARVGVIRF